MTDLLHYNKNNSNLIELYKIKIDGTEKSKITHGNIHMFNVDEYQDIYYLFAKFK